MLEKLNLILSKDFEEIVNSSISLTLLEIYSKYYLSGGQPRTCRQSQLSYYQTIIKDKTKLIEAMTEKTNICKLKGLKYIPKPLCKHYDLENLTDKEASMLLEKGWLKESDFEKLPVQYVEDKKVEAEIIAEEKKAKKEVKKTTKKAE